MPYPDKANGQQAHDRTCVSVFLRALLLGLLLCVAGLPDPAPAETAVLRKIRMGNHGAYIRVVFEFSETVPYELSENAAAGSASLRFPQTKSELPVSPVANRLGCIDTLALLQDKNHLVANILFDPKGVKLTPFTLQGPDRMVMDVFCGQELVPADTQPEPKEVVHEPRDETPEPRDMATGSTRAATETLLEKPEPTRPSFDKVQPSIDQIQIQKKAPKKKDSSQQYLLLLLAAITGIIVALIALIIFQKRNLPESHATGNPDATSETDDMMRAIDTKIKEKLMKYDE